MQHKIAIFLSGSGSNARNICQFFENHATIEVGLLLTNKENSGAKSISEDFGIPYFTFTKDEFYDADFFIPVLEKHQIDTIILAGFLWLIPDYLLQKFPDRIINIHPALLPKYGGKGMHGMHVHKAVFDNKEKETGITIHLCNEKYDDGKILLQKSVDLNDADTPEMIAKKIAHLEHEYFPKTIEAFLNKEDFQIV